MSIVPTAVILAGGANRRYPNRKAFIEIDGLPIVQRTISLLQQRFSRILISTNRPEEFFSLGLPMIGDVLPSRGPMCGMHATLRYIGKGAALFVACDMPFVLPELIELLCNRHREGSSATIPVFHNRPQPLLGVYSASLVQSMESAVLQDRVQLWRFLDDAGADYLPEDELKKIDADGRSFVNINTVADHADAVALSLETRVR